MQRATIRTAPGIIYITVRRSIRGRGVGTGEKWKQQGDQKLENSVPREEAEIYMRELVEYHLGERGDKKGKKTQGRRELQRRKGGKHP